MLKHTVSAVCVHCLDKLPSDERSAGGPGEGEPSLNGSPGRPFLLYRQRHVLFSAGRKENVGLEQWVLESVTLWLAEDMKTYAPGPTYGMHFLRIYLTIGPGCCALDPRDFRPRESHQSAPGAPEGSAGSPRTPGLRQ